MPGTVEPIPGGAVITNVPALSYATGCDSFVLALSSAATALQIEVSYSLLKGLSATAFRLIFPRDWKRYTPDALQGYDHTRLAYGALGLRADPLAIDPQEPQARAEMRRIILERIGAGYPLLGLGMMGWEDWGLIAGYRDEGETLLCRTPHDGADEFPPARCWPWMIQAISQTGPLPPRKGAIQRSLRTGVQLFEEAEQGGYVSGAAAYRFWIDGLHEEDFYAPYETGTPAVVKERMTALLAPAQEGVDREHPLQPDYLERAHVNFWRLKSLIDARRSAAVYLLETADFFSGEVGARLGAAGRDYEEVVTLLEMARPFAPAESSLGEQVWSQRQRDKQAALLMQAAEVEEVAIQAIRAALARMTIK